MLRTGDHAVAYAVMIANHESMAQRRDAPATLAAAMSAHQRGQLHEAEAAYRDILRSEPRHADALSLLGMLLCQRGEHSEGVAMLDASLASEPLQPAALVNHGNGLQALGRHEEAIADYDRALALDPRSAEAHNNRGNALQRLQRFEEALAAYERAVAIRAAYFSAHNNRCTVLQMLGRHDEALAAIDTAIRLNAAFADAHNRRGTILQDLGREEEALASFEEAIRLSPEYAEAHVNRGNALRALQRPDDATACYTQAIAIDPACFKAHNNLGVVLQEQRRYEEALASFERAIALVPNHPDAHFNRGNALRELRRYEEALACFERAGDLDARADAPAHYERGVVRGEIGCRDEALASVRDALEPGTARAEANWNLALLKLLLGNYEEGWRLHEWRWQATHLRARTRKFEQPLWLGDTPLQGRTVLLHAEQGFGDTLQFVRYVPWVVALGASVYVEVPQALADIVLSMDAEATLLTHGEPLPDFDLHCPLMSLPLAFRTTLATIPARTPYLSASDERRAAWRERLGERRRPRIGLAWSGNPRHRNDRNRSIALQELLPLLAIDADFHAVQNELRDGDKSILEAEARLQWHGAHLSDFADTAALLTELDMLITVDTAVAHLAGALGKPLWILLPHTPDFRWLLQRDDSPWYPSARLFRQGADRHWRPVVQRVLATLRTLPATGWERLQPRSTSTSRTSVKTMTLTPLDSSE